MESRNRPEAVTKNTPKTRGWPTEADSEPASFNFLDDRRFAPAIEEGLLAPLDLQAGGAIAVNLRDLYDYIVRRLTQGNLHSDDVALADCASLVQTLRETWDAIAPQVDLPARAAA